MKPLTIDELKALEWGEWIYITTSKYGSWYCKKERSEYAKASEGFVANKPYSMFGMECPYSSYGDGWLTYRNKEEAEAKGEIVELRCKIGDEVFYVGDGNIFTYTIDKIGCDQEGWYFTVDDEDHFEHYFDDESIIGVTVFFERDKAEAKLKELQGKHE